MIRMAKTDIAKKIASYLLEIQAIKLSPSKPFTWASGWKSPIYCDNRLSLSYPEIRKFITQELTNIIREHKSELDGISGVATAGISQGALVADQLNLPYTYVRSSAKKHGMTNKIEGKVQEGQKIVLIEDLISTGGSAIDAAIALKEVACEPIAIASIFTYGFSVAEDNLQKAGIDLLTLCNYDTLIQVAREEHKITEDQIAHLSSWKELPSEWSPQA